MKVVKVGKDKYRRGTFLDWIGENCYGIGCAMLTVAVIVMAVVIIG